MALQLASKPELLLYLGVVVFLQLLVLRDGMQLSEDAAAAITSAPARPFLPARLTSILSVPAAYLEARRQAKLDGPQPPMSWHLLHRPVAWLRSRPRDVSDVQWREFRGGLGPLAAALAGFVGLSHLARLRGTRMRLLNSAMASVAFIGVTHGPTGTAWVFLLASISFMLSKAVAGTGVGPVVIWGWHFASFLYIRWNDGLKFGSFSSRLNFLDGHSSMLRWHIHYNFLLLRLLSFAMDLHWARKQEQQRLQQQQQQQQKLGKHEAGSPEQQQLLAWASSIKGNNPKARTAPLPLSFYNPLQHFVYCFYPPLYIAGPIITFNDFASQMWAPIRQKPMQVLAYGARWLGAALLLELMSRTLYFNAIAKYGLLAKGVLARAGLDARPYHFALTGFWVLVYMWLKFLVIWRFFRTAALADGIVPPENMGRCVCNNYDIEGFWRSWHSSYNRWLVRYVYVPLGGNRLRILNVWLVFLFVAAWHDLEPRLMHWGLIMPAALVPELAVKALGRMPWALKFADSALYRHMAALAATFNIIGLMCVNLVGFVVGLEGLPHLLLEVFGQTQTALPVLFALFCAAQLMFALRSLQAKAEAVVTEDKHGHAK